MLLNYTFYNEVSFQVYKKTDRRKNIRQEKLFKISVVFAGRIFLSIMGEKFSNCCIDLQIFGVKTSPDHLIVRYF